MPLPDDEEIVRAICTDKWDGERIAPSAFMGPDTSVSRLIIIPLEDQWEVFRRGVERPPERLLKRIAQIGVGRLGELGRTHSPPVSVTVEADPVDWNPAHAIIPGKRSRGLANRIKDALTVHEPPAGF
ncbi:MAG: hypothetical protein ABMA01_02730 [Chthoniobacteraceae bacterium]